MSAKREKNLYILYIASAVFVFFFFVMHTLMMHIKPIKEALHPKTPYFIYVLDLSILIMLFHGLYGIRGIIIEKKGYRKSLDIVFVVLGIFLGIVLVAAKHRVI